jgi:hypothetical protein
VPLAKAQGLSARHYVDFLSNLTIFVGNFGYGNNH